MDLNKLGKFPISDSSPSGEDVRYDPDFEILQAEIDKLSTVTADSVTNWDVVIAKSALILEKKSKNLLVAAYLGAGLSVTHGIPGIAASTVILHDIIDGFWETLFPPKKRMRGRLNAISWWFERIRNSLEQYSGEPIDQEILNKLQAAITNLDRTLSEKSDDAPILSSLREYVNRLPAKEVPQETPSPPEDATVQTETIRPEQPQPAVVPVAPQPTPVQAVSVPSPPPVPQLSTDSAENVQQLLNFGLEQLSTVADILLQTAPENFKSYQLRRLAAWTSIARTPPAENGRTMIPPPDSQIMQSLSAMFTKGDYAACLKASESRIGESLFWLDLSRLSAQSLDSMGAEYKEAGDTVRNVTAAYVERLPQIITLSFADGTPFADASTKEWLAGLRKSSDTATSNGEEVSIESRFAKALSQGADLIRDNKRIEAIAQLKDTLNGAVTPQEQYLFSAAMARLLTGMGRSDLAQANVDAIISTIDNFTLERWDPNLALIGLEAAYMALTAYQEGDTLSTESKRTDIIMRMTRLDPSRTLEVVGG